MDLFQYTLAIKEVDTFKHNNKREAFIRKHYNELENIGVSKWYTSIQDKDMDSATLLYKCCIKAMKEYSSAKGLPDFITNGISNLELEILRKLIDNEAPYEKFIKAFEFNDTVTTPGLNKEDLINLINIFQQEPIPFVFEYNYYTNSLSNSVRSITKSNDNIRYILEGEEIKRSLGNKTYSILEDFLATYYDQLPASEKTLTTSKEIVELAKNLVTVSETINAKLKG